MVSPERANEIADQVRGIVQKATFEAAATSKKINQLAANQVNARAISRSTAESKAKAKRTR